LKNLGGHRGPPKISEDSATCFRGERIAESIIINIYNQLSIVFINKN
jgi:hypothetical protein